MLPPETAPCERGARAIHAPAAGGPAGVRVREVRAVWSRAGRRRGGAGARGIRVVARERREREGVWGGERVAGRGGGVYALL